MVSLMIHDRTVMMIYVSRTVEALTEWTKVVRGYGGQVLILRMEVSSFTWVRIESQDLFRATMKKKL